MISPTVTSGSTWSPNYSNSVCYKCNGSGAYITNKCNCSCKCCEPKAVVCENCKGTGYVSYQVTYTTSGTTRVDTTTGVYLN